ncbi:unnamed protein product [Cylicostephanus goldi]|uniref:Uncharacterized protein n=1 Tax=Cylicostephanus goldi TaxID=71465 RepID=A0A3P6R4C4_CYLGO|nr:unnamed protein product [Cylicostephanus goldi]
MGCRLLIHLKVWAKMHPFQECIIQNRLMDMFPQTGEGQSKTPYCEECYLVLVKGKFRSTISKRRIFKDRERKVLVILDGSKESAFLFRQVEDAMKQTNFKRLILEPSFIFLVSADMTDVRVVEEHLAVLRQALPGSYYMVHLAAIFGDIQMVDNGTCSGLQHVTQLKEFLASFRTAVSREEAVRILKVRLLQKLSRHTEVPKVPFTPTSRFFKCYYYVGDATMQ